MTNKFLITLFLIINFTAFLVILFDKNKSKKAGAERISEGLLFFMAVCFGSIGVFLGMLAFRHKTQKWHFIIGIPLLIFQNCATIYFLSSLMQ